MRFLLGVLLAGSALAQAPFVPLIDPRGVVDYFRPTPAPATVARGGILLINGANLGPSKAVAATAAPLPVKLGNPEVQATINGTAIPLFSVSSDKVIAQVPYDAPMGTVSVKVSVGGVTGPAAGVVIVAAQPAIRTMNGLGTGLYAGTTGSNSIILAASGLGATRPALTAGDLPGKNLAVPQTPVIAYIGGVRVTAAAAASTTRIGEFDVKLTVPDSAQPGDLIYLVVGGRASNAVVYQTLSAPVIRMQALPPGSPAIVSLATPDVSGNFVIPFGARDSSGCTAAIWFDMNAGKSGPLGSCLADPTRGALSPLVLPPNSEVAGALVGPPAGTPPAGISSTVAIANANDDSLKTASLAGDASSLTGTIDATFVATIPGTPAVTQTINGMTGAVNTLTPGNGGGGGGGGAAGGPIAGPTSVNVGGLTHIVSAPAAIGNGQFALVAADDAVAPTQAIYAVVQSSGDVVASQPFPSGWLPLIPTKPTAASPAVLDADRVDAATRSIFLLARASDASQDAFLVFPLDASAAPTVTTIPAGWFACSCGGAIRLTPISLYPAVVLGGSNVAESNFSNPCGSTGFLVLDLAARKVAAYPLGPGSQLSVSSLVNFNDFVYGTNIDPAKRNTADTVYVFDAASAAEYDIQLPTGSVSFAAAQPVTGTNWLLATVTNRTAGDGGFVQFDLESGIATLFPIPDGFSSVQVVGNFLATGKIVARGLVQGSRNFQLLIFDLASNSVATVQNPDGVASFGPPQVAAPTPGGGGGAGGPGGGPGGATAARLPIPVGNAKANTVAAPAYDDAGKQTGIMVVRIP
jgi:uncharacterized protein (TIGR03437 family)